MKPPWKYLAQLMSRQRPPETPEPTNAAGARKTVEIELRPATAILLPFPSKAHDPEPQHKIPDNAILAPAAIDAEIDTAAPVLVPVDIEAEAFEPEGKEPLGSAMQMPAADVVIQAQKVQQAQRKPSRSNRADPIGQVQIPDRAPEMQETSSVNSFFDELTDVDGEIKRLRDLLADKLRIQNAQLKEMLERFERS
jgi:hypothetical protein